MSKCFLNLSLKAFLRHRVFILFVNYSVAPLVKYFRILGLSKHFIKLTEKKKTQTLE